MKTKKITILMGNPDKDGTLSNELADSYEHAAKAAGHEVRRANISDLQFDPLLHKGYKVIQELEPDLLKLQDDLRWADHFVLVYPLWWSATPALLKGLFDRMWLPAFAFRFHKKVPFIGPLGWDKLLAGKTARVVVLSKSQPWQIRLLFGDFSNEIVHATLGFAGYKVHLTEVGNSEALSPAKRDFWNRHLAHLGTHGT